MTPVLHMRVAIEPLRACVRVRVRVRVLVRVRIRVRVRDRVARLRDAPHELVEEAVLLVPEGLEGRGLGLRPRGEWVRVEA